jgi:acetyl esterase/lipase
MVSRESREYLRELRKRPAFGAEGFNLHELRTGMATRRPPADDGVRCIASRIAEMPCEWVVAPDADPDVRLMYLHGGGYVSGSGAFYLAMAAHISTAARCAVFLPDYRLAPENPFPAALEDCIVAYEWMATEGPLGPAPARASFIAGDSAGGGLTLATLVSLRDRRRPLPKAGVTVSAFADLTLAGESLQSEATNDPIMSPKCLPTFVRLYLGEADPRTPLASPVFADYRGAPPLLIQAGEHEIIRDDSVRTAAKAQSDGVETTLEVWPGMFHVFQSHEPLLPEAREAIEHIASFMQSHLA